MTAEKLEKLETLKKEYAEKKSVYEALDKRDKYYKAAFEAGIITEEETESEQSTLAAMKKLGIKLDYLKTEIKSIERQHTIELEKDCFAELIQRLNWLDKIEYEAEPLTRKLDWFDKLHRAGDILRELFPEFQKEEVCW